MGRSPGARLARLAVGLLDRLGGELGRLRGELGGALVARRLALELGGDLAQARGDLAQPAPIALMVPAPARGRSRRGRR